MSATSQPKVVAVKVPVYEWQLSKQQWDVRQLERRQEYNDRAAFRDSDEESDGEEFKEAETPDFQAEGGGPPACQVVVQVTFFQQTPPTDSSVALWVHVYDYTPNMTPMELMMQRVQASRAAAGAPTSSLLEESESSPPPPPQPQAPTLPPNALKPGRGAFGTLSLAIPMSTGASPGTRPTVCMSRLMDCVEKGPASGGVPQAQSSSALAGPSGMAGESSAVSAETGNDISPQMNFGAALGERLTRFYAQRRVAGTAPQIAVYGSCGVSEEVAQHFLGDGGMGTLSSASVVVFGKQVYGAARAIIDKEFEAFTASQS